LREKCTARKENIRYPSKQNTERKRKQNIVILKNRTEQRPLFDMNITDSKRFEQSRDHRSACQSSTIVGQKIHQSAMGWPETQKRAVGQYRREENTRIAYYLSLQNILGNNWSSYSAPYDIVQGPEKGFSYWKE